MREIKFRAWSPATKTMYTKVMVGNISDPNSEDYTANAILKDGEWVNSDEHDNIEWMQYTELKDANGVEIYEGDVLYHPKQGFRKVIYPLNDSFAGFGLVSKEGMKNTLQDSDRLYEVVGNIYENPELLEVSDE